jgi:hypothetical protein
LFWKDKEEKQPTYVPSPNDELSTAISNAIEAFRKKGGFDDDLARTLRHYETEANLRHSMRSLNRDVANVVTFG